MEQNYGKEEFQTQNLLIPNQKPAIARQPYMEIKVKFLSWNQSVLGSNFTWPRFHSVVLSGIFKP